MARSPAGNAVYDAVQAHLDDLTAGTLNKAQLARKLVDLHPGLFTSLDHARDMIRRYTGARGKSTVNLAANFVSNTHHGMRALPNPYLGDDGPDVFVWDTAAHRKPLIFSDVHLPYHAPEPIMKMVEEGKKWGPDSILINGDLVDLYQQSSFCRDAAKPDAEAERLAAIEFLLWLREQFPSAAIFWKLGNHELRYERLIKAGSSQVRRTWFKPWAELFELDNLGITLIGGMTRIEAGHLNILHGHEFGESVFSPVNPARGAFLKSKTNILVSHHHATSEHHETTVDGRAVGAWSIGCLCSLTPEYRRMAYTKWNHGYATVEFDGPMFRVENRRIL